MPLACVWDVWEDPCSLCPGHSWASALGGALLYLCSFPGPAPRLGLLISPGKLPAAKPKWPRLLAQLSGSQVDSVWLLQDIEAIALLASLSSTHLPQLLSISAQDLWARSFWFLQVFILAFKLASHVKGLEWFFFFFFESAMLGHCWHKRFAFVYLGQVWKSNFSAKEKPLLCLGQELKRNSVARQGCHQSPYFFYIEVSWLI